MWQGAPAMSIQWGAWGGGGMAGEPVLAARLARAGMGALPPPAGLAALAGALAGLSATRTPGTASIAYDMTRCRLDGIRTTSDR